MDNLFSPLDDRVIYEGKEINLNLSFDRVLAMYDLFSNDIFSEKEKYDLALEIIVKNIEALTNFSYEEKATLLKIIYDNFLKTKKKSGNDEKVFDFKQDADYIYSSFYKEYQIDLFKQMGKLHWSKFQALFDGLGEKTKIKEVIKIRTMEIPVPDKNNGKQIQKIYELKTQFALEMTEEEREAQFNKAIDKLADKLENWAIKAGETK